MCARRSATHDGVSNIIFIGGGVHAVVDDADLRIPELRAALQAQNVPFDDIAVVAPTIEDVFVALLEDEGRRQ